MPASEPPQPAAQIDLAAIGYRTPPLMERMSEDEPTVSLNFVDADHVLLTFDPKKMFKRLPQCTAAHQDRLMRAAILELPSGKVVTQADWYLHDHRPYLWPFGPGKFLLRRANDLYVVDSTLHEKLLWTSTKDLLWVSVTPTGNQIIVETAEDPAEDPAAAPNSTPARPDSPAKLAPKFLAQFLDAATLAPERTVPLNNVVNITGTSTGYVDLVHHANIWLIRFGPNPKVRHNIARVKSQTIPAVFYGSRNTLQIGWCGSSNCDFSVSSFTLAGRRLWHQRWSHFRISPSVVRDEDNSRFGVSTWQQKPQAAGTQPPYDSDDALQQDPSQRDVFQQDIQVFDTASGNAVFSYDLIPAIASGLNFSLSPDGRRAAVVRGDHLELFELPPISADEQSKYAQIKTEVQDSSVLNASTDEKDEDAGQEAINASSAANSGIPQDPSAADSPAKTDHAASAGEKPSPASAPSQSTEATAAPLLTLKVSTRAVVVDVVVTDGKGHPVKGLPQEDFQLTEDGKPQSVRSFREFSGAVTAPESPPLAEPTRRTNIFTNAIHGPDPGAVTMILLDLLNTPAQDQMYARDQLIKFLEAKPKDERLALCILSSGASNLTLVQGFTPDDALLLAAVRSKKGRPESPRWQGAGVEAANSVNTVGILAQGGRSSGFGNLLGALQGMQDLQHVEETDSRVNITTDSMIQLARYLSAIPGRKNLVWLSESFPIAIGIIESVNNTSADNRNYSEKLRHMTNMLAESQVAVYPVDVRGLVAGGFEASSTGSMISPPPLDPSTVGTAKILTPTPQTPQGFGELDELVSERNTLADVAQATGGKAFFSVNDIRGAITTAIEQGSAYYALSYTSTNKIYNGKFRKIKVALAQKQKGYSLHYRQGYFAEPENSKAPDADLARSTRMMAMQHASPPSRQILFSATVVPAGKKTMNHAEIGEVIPVSSKKPILPPLVDVQHYAIDYLLDGSAVHFVPEQNGTYRSILTLMAASFNNQGTMLTGLSHVGISNLQPSVYKEAISGKLVLHEEANVPTQAAYLRLGIQDQMSGHIGTIEIPLPVPVPPNTPRRARHKLPEIEKD
jgi:VWFA-related protein